MYCSWYPLKLMPHLGEFRPLLNHKRDKIQQIIYLAEEILHPPPLDNPHGSSPATHLSHPPLSPADWLFMMRGPCLNHLLHSCALYCYWSMSIAITLSSSLLLLLMLHSAIPEMASGTAVAADGRRDGRMGRVGGGGSWDCWVREGGRRHRCPLSEAKAQS